MKPHPWEGRQHTQYVSIMTEHEGGIDVPIETKFLGHMLNETERDSRMIL